MRRYDTILRLQLLKGLAPMVGLLTTCITRPKTLALINKKNVFSAAIFSIFQIKLKYLVSCLQLLVNF